jgi:hypothetical protein
VSIQAIQARLLRPQGVEDGLALAWEASDRGDGAASALLAMLTATGVFMPQDWPAALDLLQRAAAQGDVGAKGQLAALDYPARGLQELLALPPRRPLCERPRVRQCDGFASAAVCRWLIGLARGRLERGLTIGADGSGQATSGRTNSSFAFSLFDGDVVVALVRERIARMLSVPLAAIEPPHLFHYATGQAFRLHADYLNRPDASERIATFLLYLNDDFGGGETWFPRAPLKARPAAGGGLYFANVDPRGAPDPMSLHAGLAPTRGEKWLFSQWVHDRAYTG